MEFNTADAVDPTNTLSLEGGQESLPDDAAQQGRVTRFPHTLKNPLLRTELLKLMMALEGLQEHPEIRSGATLRSERKFADAIVRSGFARGARRRMCTDADIIAAIRSARTHGRLWPTDIPSRAARKAYASVRAALASRGADPGPAFPDFDQTTRDCAGAALLHRDAYDAVRRGDFDRESPWIVYGRGRMQHIVTPWGAGYRAGGDFVYFPLTFLLGIIEPLENLMNAHIGYDVLRQGDRFRAVTHSYINRVVEWQYQCVEKYGGQGHAIAKATESIYKSVASARTPRGDIPGAVSGFAKMCEKYLLKEEALGTPRAEAMTLQLIHLTEEIETSEEATEMSGLMRMFGYPIVDPLVSAAKSRRIGSAPDRSDPEAVIMAVRLFSHLVLKNYILKHGKWPPIRFRNGDPRTPDGPVRETRLKRMHDSGLLNVVDRSYPLQDWDEAEIHDIGSFDYHADYLELLADKATFCGLGLRESHYAGRLPDPLHRRLISRILGHSDIDMREELRRFATDQLPPDVFGCDLVPKELEHKAEARMYTIIDETVRRCLSTVQENVKSGIFPYIPYTSMAMNAAQLSRELHSSTRLTGRRTLKLETDLSSWNIRFLRFWCELMGHKMDRMMGVTGYFGQSHRFFQRSEFCVTTRDARIPQLENPVLRGDREEDNDAMWGGDASGKEGIEQRFWTTLTAVMMYMALWDEPYTFKLLGQGDNQTIVIDFGVMDDARLAEETVRVEKKIEATCLSLNHDAKPEEFLGSMSMLTYSKVTMIDGRQIPLELKFSMKMGHSVDELDPSIEDAVGSIFSAGLAVAKNSRNPLDCWLLSCIHAEWFMTRASLGKTEFPTALTSLLRPIVRSDALVLALMTPSVIGGFPVVPWTDFLVTGDPDPLSSAVAMVKAITPHLPVMRGVQGYLMDDMSYVERVSLRSLVENPTGIPLAAAPGGRAVLRDAAIEYLTGVRNVAIAELAQDAQMSAEMLVDDLVSMRPLYPTMVRDLFDISSVGRAHKVVGKFKASATVSSIVASAGITNELVVRGWQRFASAIARLQSMHSHSRRAPAQFPRGHSNVVADALRLRWGLGEGGIQGVSTMQALDFPVLDTLGPGVLGVIEASYDLGETGPHRPYMGSRTRERRAEREYEVVREPGTADLGKLILSLTAGQVSPAVRSLYEKIAASRTGLSLEQLAEVFPSTIGGTPGHRYDAMRSASSMAPVGNPAPLGWVSLNTDNVPGVSASTVDWPLPMQMMMSWTCALASSVMRAGNHSRRVVRLALSVEGQVPLVDPYRNMPAPSVQLTRRVGNPLVDIPDVSVRNILERLNGSRQPTDPMTTTVRINVMSGIFAVRLIRSGGGSMIAELGTEAELDAVEPDAAACVSSGGSVVYSSAVRACAIAAIWHTMLIIGPEDLRHHIDAVLDNISYAAAGTAMSCLRHSGVDKTSLIERGIWSPAVGTGGDRAVFDVLRRNLRWHAGVLVRDPGRVRDSFRDCWLPDRSRGLPVAFGARYRMATMCWGWIVGSGQRITGIAKRFIALMTREVRSSRLDGREASALVIPLIGQVAGAFANLVADENLVVHLDLLSLSGLASSGVPTCDLDEVSAWRSLRYVPERVATRDPRLPSPLVLDNGALGGPEIVIHSEEIVEFPPLSADPPSRTLEEIVEDRMERTAGRRTTVAQVWGGLLSHRDSPALVVGTGSGGIQALLASYGGESEGLDLSSTLPHSAAADPSYRPPECADAPSASYSRAVWETDGDWMKPNVSSLALSQRRWRTVVIDIEQGDNRLDLHVLEPLCEHRYSGVVLVRLIGTMDEAAVAVARVSCAPGTRDVSVTAGQSTGPSDVARPYILRFTVRSMSMIPDRGPRAELRAWRPRRLPGDAATPAERFSRSLQSLTGGLFHARSHEELVHTLDRRVDEARRSRASTTHGTLLSACKIHYALVVISEMRVHEGSTRSEIAREYVRVCSAPRADGRYGLVTVLAHDPHVQYILWKVMPRYLASIP